MPSHFPIFGSAVLYCVMVVAAYTFAISIAAGANGKARTLQAARFGAYGTVALIGVAVLCLAYAFVSHDFRLRYVAHYSDRSMPIGFLLTALWGGQDGSLLWWMFLLSIYIGLCVRWLGKRYLELQPYVIATLMAVILFFCVLMAFAANPFSTAIGAPRVDGEGLNPLLQNFYMIIHPPSLYIGFVGCTIPFAFAIAALVTGRLDHEWIVASRKWMLFAWTFLAIGNTLGMLWAYEELGWGGYWAWDPVENAAFMPFLSASAYVHSVMIQERRGMLKVWNVTLICLTFFMTIFGTFLTRAGLISSVHAFAQSSIGGYFVGFLFALVAFSLTLVLYRWPELRGYKPSTRLRVAAIATGWAVVALTAVAYECSALIPTPAETGGGGGTLSGTEAFDSVMTKWRLIKVAVFAVLLGAGVFGSVELVFRRLTAKVDLRARRTRFESVLSREFTFLLNNFGLLILMFVILFLTIFPMIVDLVTGEKASIAAPFFAHLVVPVALLIFILMGVGTLFGWKKTSSQSLGRAFIAPTAAFIGTIVLHFALGKALGFPAVVWGDPVYGGPLGQALRAFNAFTPVMGLSLCAFNAAVIVQEFVLVFRARARTSVGRKRQPIARAFDTVTGFLRSAQSRRRYGGYIVHLGIVLMFFGFTGKSWNTDRDCSLKPGESFAVVGDFKESPTYTLRYMGSRRDVDNTKQMIFAEVDVFYGEYDPATEPDRTPDAHLAPAKFIYNKMRESPTTEVAMLHRPQNDLYLALGSLDHDTRAATIQIHVNPLVSFIWFGCIVLIMGSVVSMWPQLEANESRVWAYARSGASIAASVAVGILLAGMPSRAMAQGVPSQHSTGTVHIENPQEREVFSALRCMCGGCARELISTCSCSMADATREEIRGKLAKGMTREEIMDEYVKEWGEILHTSGVEALAVPPNRGGFNLLWAVPLSALGMGAAGLVLLMRKWRGKKGDDDRRDGGAPAPVVGSAEAAPKKNDEYDSRLDAELKDLDG